MDKESMGWVAFLGWFLCVLMVFAWAFARTDADTYMKGYDAVSRQLEQCEGVRYN